MYLLTGKRSLTRISVNDRLLHGEDARMTDTKENILHTALRLFARDGYEDSLDHSLLDRQALQDHLAAAGSEAELQRLV